MPLCVSQTRNNEKVRIPWTMWHLGIMFSDYPDLQTKGEHIITEDKKLGIDEAAIFSDGEPGKIYVWELKKGDILRMWRE